MRRKWGKALLAVVALTLGLVCVAVPALATDTWEKGSMPLTLAGTQTPLEAQMLGEKPFQSHPTLTDPASNLLSGALPGLRVEQDGATTIKLPRNLEMKISVLYNRDGENQELNYVGPVRRRNPLLMKYSLDYRLLPNLQVGLNSYLYRPDNSDQLNLAKPFGSQVMGLGPGLKYDLGRWSFLLKSQVETGGEHKDLQNWFRVWYAF